MGLAKLYPAIDFPVSRGTPMISSLIEWDHSEDHFVTEYETKASRAERSYTVNISEPEYDFVHGHAIDGELALRNVEN